MPSFIHCYHQKISTTIFNIVSCAWLLAFTLVVNYFHLSFHFHGLDFEKIEFGLIVVFLFLRKVKLIILLFVAFCAPFLDHILHGHSLIIAPLEAVFNFLTLLAVAFFFNLFLKTFSKWRMISFFVAALSFILVLKLLYFVLIFFLFINQINFFQITNWKNNWSSDKQFFLLSFFLLFVLLKFAFLLALMLSIKKKWR